MQALRDLARQLLAEDKVKVVIGWEEGRRGVRPFFATDATQTELLVFDHRCVHNLAAYLSPRRPQVPGLRLSAGRRSRIPDRRPPAASRLRLWGAPLFPRFTLRRYPD